MSLGIEESGPLHGEASEGPASLSGHREFAKALFSAERTGDIPDPRRQRIMYFLSDLLEITLE
jgi:hypothetical protein